MDSDWKQRAEALFFNGEKITAISGRLGVSVRSVSKHLNGLPEYAAEVKRRTAANQSRKDYYRDWKRKSRGEQAHMKVTGESVRAEHELAVRILSRERYF